MVNSNSDIPIPARVGKGVLNFKPNACRPKPAIKKPTIGCILIILAKKLLLSSLSLFFLNSIYPKMWLLFNKLSNKYTAKTTATHIAILPVG